MRGTQPPDNNPAPVFDVEELVLAREKQRFLEILRQGTQHDQSMAVIEAVKAARFRATCGLIDGSMACIFRSHKVRILLGGKSSGWRSGTVTT